MTNRAFTLFEVLIALGVFALAVTGLAIALQSAVDASLMARQRAMSRVVIESRLAMAMSDPPLDGRREIEGSTNNGLHVLETFEQAEIQTTNGTLLPGMWTLKVTADRKGGASKEMAEILIYRP